MLTDCSFWRDFLANFLSDLLVGLIVGIPLAWWVGRQLSKSERSQELKDEKRSKIGKTLKYLEPLKEETDSLIGKLPGLIQMLDKRQARDDIELVLSTPVWDVLEPSGELPRLLDPQVLVHLARFYNYVRYARLGIDRYLSNTGHTIQAFTALSTASDALANARSVAENLASRVASQIQNLQEELETLSAPSRSGINRIRRAREGDTHTPTPDGQQTPPTGT